MRIAFLTSTPLNVVEGSGTFTGVATLAAGLRRLGTTVELITPNFGFPIYTIRRLWFNEQLGRRRWDGFDLVVGCDMDGYRIAGRTGRPQVASVKGVIADEMRFEAGMTRRTMAIQAACERLHVRRASLVMTTSKYAAGRIRELYGTSKPVSVVPEAIDLTSWKELLARNAAEPDPRKFTVFTVCRFYPRKRLNLLLAAAARLRDEIPGLEVRIAGDGPERTRLQADWRRLGLGNVVQWLGDVPQNDLAREYNRCDVFCLPSVQEGFGIVFLEAMAAGKPIVAVRSAAVPEVVEQGLLVEPESHEALAEALLHVHRDTDLRSRLAKAGTDRVKQFDAAGVASLFLAEVGTLF